MNPTKVLVLLASELDEQHIDSGFKLEISLATVSAHK